MTGIGIELLVPLFVGIAAGLMAAITLRILKGYGLGTLLGIAVIFFIIGVVVARLIIPIPALVEVPNIVGYSEDDAEKIIEEKDLIFNVIDRIHSDTVQKYKIISQDPPPGLRVNKDSVTNVVVSIGPQTTSTQKPTPTPFVQITDPEDGDYIPWRYTVKGTSNIDPNSNFNIYVFIYALDWYAQPKAIISSNGDWETRDGCRFGNLEYLGLGYTYDICAIVTTEDFEDEEQFANLPDYEEKSETITVTRE